MSLPTEADFAVVKMGDGASTEVFTILCGLDQVTINRTANTNDRFRRDCAAPGTPAYRKSRTTGKQMDVTANGAINIPDITRYNAALGVVKNYRIELGQYDGTPEGEIIHVINGAFNLTNANSGVGDEGNADVSLASDGVWTEGAPT
ncbi:hypothetical protein [Sphingobium yanoikuyae]|uniref:Phage tail protein n=1 Tax=Sphingobium yanoikuyae TaxID=13690 RepID=A0A0J9D3I4_SPHYA|nr:hypothetical protein [Sphingobium yanoikuyae]ATP19794.1 hypothetical protein BV87_16260 [Sphingobium yanoikuyae]KMW31992.1 hypothetical protein BV87_21100 [Sphingobium yanoikuyae]